MLGEKTLQIGENNRNLTMSKITSQTVTLNTPIQAIFEFLSNLNNYNQLLPADNISEFTSSEDACSFKVQNAYQIGLEKHQVNAPNSIVLNSSANSPIKFQLTIHIAESNAQTSTYLDCDAELNPILKMMVEKPLKNLFDYMANKLVEVKG
jgi:carbon monoxide dehydrogenase subunit G